MSLIGWSDTAYRDRPPEGRCRSGCVVGLMSSTLSGAYRILQWASKFNRKLVKTGLGGKAYAFSEMVDHVALLRDFPALFTDMSPGAVCLALPQNRTIIAGKFLARHFPGLRQALSNRG